MATKKKSIDTEPREKKGWIPITTKFPVNMKASLESGQPLTFHSVYKTDNGIAHLSYVTEKGAIELQYRDGVPVSALRFRYHGDYTASSAGDEISRRFGLEDDMPLIYKSISTDRHMRGAIEGLYGMRVTQNDPWETTLCFVISQFNNIKRIKGIVRTMVNRYGDEMDTGERSTRLFPSPEAVSRASVDELKACGAGFRARYIKNVARAVAEEVDLGSIQRMDYEEAKGLLMGMEGIGDKVADCILLMGYKKLDAFPIDVWIKRSMESLYFDGRKTSIKAIHEFADRNWGDYAGYAQQYLFHSARTRQ